MKILRWEPAACAALSLAALSAAWISQHHFDMQPCPWCVLQRLVFALLALLSGLQMALGAMQAPLSILRAALAAAGLAAAVWQHTVASASASCVMTLADRIMAVTRLDALLPDMFQPRASCLEAKAWLLGVPYEFYSAALFALIMLMALARARIRRS